MQKKFETFILNDFVKKINYKEYFIQLGTNITETKYFERFHNSQRLIFVHYRNSIVVLTIWYLPWRQIIKRIRYPGGGGGDNDFSWMRWGRMISKETTKRKDALWHTTTIVGADREDIEDDTTEWWWRCVSVESGRSDDFYSETIIEFLEMTYFTKNIPTSDRLITTV